MYQNDIEKYHGNYEVYRQLYAGEHEKVFKRAEHLVNSGELSARLQYGNIAKQMSTPYVIVNVSKMIVDIPTLFIARSLGDLKTNYPINEEELNDDYEADTEHLEGNQDEEVFDLQQETLDQIAENSKLYQQHTMNLKQWQIDGGLVLVPEVINGKVKLSFKERNIYYELDDGVTYQLRYFKELDDEEYLHIHQETEHENGLEVEHMVYTLNAKGEETEVEDDEIIEAVTNIKAEDRHVFYEGRKNKFFEYLPYNPTFMNKYGNSAIAGLEDKQDEVNWTMTRTAQIFERNGKPRISVTKEIMDRLVQISEENFGVPYKHDHRNLEVTEINDQGQSLQIHQIDVSKIGDITYVKDIIKMMLMETQTSEKAIDFFTNGGSGSAQSGIAKFYDLFLSIMKSEQLRDEYVTFLQRGIENCLWLLNQENADIEVEKPIVMQKEMLPVTTKETAEQNNASFLAGTQSLEQTIRNNNPDKSEEWIMSELEKIEEGKTSQDSISLFRGNMTAENFNDNRPLNEPIRPRTEDIEESEEE